MVNPDVSCREEGPEGALLFNPDTGDMMVINATGLMIWQSLEHSSAIDEIISHLNNACDNIPQDRVVIDVEEFVQKLLPGGFIGEVI